MTYGSVGRPVGSRKGQAHNSVHMPICIEPGGGYLALSPSEKERFEAGIPVVKRSADARGNFAITVKITRPRAKADRMRGL